jgi:CO dehydrogenase/acetyl-CoA synthase gamma subunit (corrinoid Fe-S protein)
LVFKKEVFLMSVSGTIMEFFSIAIAGIAFPGFNYHVTPGLYPIGHPTDESPILVTANSDFGYR